MCDRNVAFAAKGRFSTPIEYNYNQNKENNDDNICSSLQIQLENIIQKIENETNDFESYHDIRSDFNNNGVDGDLNETPRVEPIPTQDWPMATSSPSSTSPESYLKKFVILGGVQRKIRKAQELCVFCKNNGQPDYVYQTHRTHDEYGRVLCPHLRNYTCPICKITGDDAHTVKYCPQKPIITVADTRMPIPSFRPSIHQSEVIPVPHRRTYNTDIRLKNNFKQYRF